MRAARPREISLLALVALAGVLLVPSPANATSLVSRTSSSSGVRRFPTWSGTKTVTYCTDGGHALAMTLFAPAPSGHPVPVVLQVHGGGWVRGHRFSTLSQSDIAAHLVDHGIVVASINYRLAPQNPWPDQIIDVMCAVRFLRARAGRLGVDANRIAAWGSSAGGQLVSLLGSAGSEPAWENDEFGNESSKVQAVVDEFGPSDLTRRDWGPYVSTLVRRVFGTAPGPSAKLEAASPVSHVAPGDPPFLIVQGTADRIVPAAQSMELAERLRAAHVPTQIDLVRGGNHGLGAPGEHPTQGQIDARIVSYLTAALGGR